MALTSLWRWVSEKQGPRLGLSCCMCSGNQTREGLRATRGKHISSSMLFVLMWWECPQISASDVLTTAESFLWVGSMEQACFSLHQCSRSKRIPICTRAGAKDGRWPPRILRDSGTAWHMLPKMSEQNYFHQKLNTSLGFGKFKFWYSCVFCYSYWTWC